MRIRNGGAVGTVIAVTSPQRTERKAVNPMKIEFPLLATLLLIGTNLLVRAQAQAVEQALFAIAIEYGVNGFRSATRLLRLSR